MSSTISNTENEDILIGVLSHWKAAVDAHDPEQVAEQAALTADVITRVVTR